MEIPLLDPRIAMVATPVLVSWICVLIVLEIIDREMM